MSKTCFLGIDTSNYTTSLAFCDESGNIVANLKRPLPVKEGERGLRQSDAVFLHTKNIPELFEEARTYFGEYRPVTIGVSAYPRTVEGSYMPCFLAGKAAAYALGSALGASVCEFSHQNGHIMAAAYSGGALPMALESPFIVFHVSGGTTEMILAQYENKDFKCKLIGGTVDINAGQAIDRVGVAMGLRFPCGPEMEALALLRGGKKTKGIHVSVKDGQCNLSGLENKALQLYHESGDRSATAAYVIDFVTETLLKMTADARRAYPGLPVIYGGGVMSCSIIKNRLAGDDVYFAAPQFSSDNAAGIALLTYHKYC